MTALMMDQWLLVFRHRHMLMRMGLGVGLPFFMAALIIVADAGSSFTSAFLVLYAVMYPAFVLSFSQKQVLAASFSFQQPALRRRFLTAQLVWAVGAGLVATLAIYFLPPHSVVFSLNMSLSLGALGSIFFLALAIMSFEWIWAFQFPMGMFFLFLIVGKSSREAFETHAPVLLAHPLPWVAGAMLLAAVLAWRLTTPNLHRRLSGKMIPVPEDWFRPGRLKVWKQQRQTQQFSNKPWPWIYEAILGRTARATVQGRWGMASFWRHLYLTATQIMSGPRWMLGMSVVTWIAFIVFGGYYEPRSLEMSRWFSAFPFMFGYLPLVTAAAEIPKRHGLLPERRTAAGIELRFWVLGLLSGLLFSGVTYLIFLILNATLPPVTFNNCTYHYLMPAPHAPWLIIWVAPLVMLASAIRKGPDSLPSILSFQFFLFLHFLLIGEWSPWPVLIITVVTWSLGGLAYWLRRRWWAKGDLGV